MSETVRLTDAQKRALKLFKWASDDPAMTGTSVNGHTETALLRMSLIERIPGRLICRITDAGRAALSQASSHAQEEKT